MDQLMTFVEHLLSTTATSASIQFGLKTWVPDGHPKIPLVYGYSMLFPLFEWPCCWGIHHFKTTTCACLILISWDQYTARVPKTAMIENTSLKRSDLLNRVRVDNFSTAQVRSVSIAVIYIYILYICVCVFFGMYNGWCSCVISNLDWCWLVTPVVEKKHLGHVLAPKLIMADSCVLDGQKKTQKTVTMVHIQLDVCSSHRTCEPVPFPSASNSSTKLWHRLA